MRRYASAPQEASPRACAESDEVRCHATKCWRETGASSRCAAARHGLLYAQQRPDGAHKRSCHPRAQMPLRAAHISSFLLAAPGDRHAIPTHCTAASPPRHTTSAHTSSLFFHEWKHARYAGARRWRYGAISARRRGAASARAERRAIICLPAPVVSTVTGVDGNGARLPDFTRRHDAPGIHVTAATIFCSSADAGAAHIHPVSMPRFFSPGRLFQ